MQNMDYFEQADLPNNSCTDGTQNTNSNVADSLMKAIWQKPIPTSTDTIQTCQNNAKPANNQWQKRAKWAKAYALIRSNNYVNYSTKKPNFLKGSRHSPRSTRIV